MGLETTKNNPQVDKVTGVDRKQLKIDMMEYHKETFTALNITSPIFAIKMQYYSKALDAQVISFFESELTNKQPTYIELTDKNFNVFPERKLYVFKHNPHFKEELIAVGDNVVRYEMLVDELEEIVLEEEEEEKTFFDIPNPDDDPLFSTMTIRDFYAIFHNKPVSRRPFLNELIKNQK
jgi:hypothetical protein